MLHEAWSCFKSKVLIVDVKIMHHHAKELKKKKKLLYVLSFSGNRAY